MISSFLNKSIQRDNVAYTIVNIEKYILSYKQGMH